MFFGQKQHWKKEFSTSELFDTSRLVFKQVNWRDVKVEDDHLPRSFNTASDPIGTRLHAQRAKEVSETTGFQVSGIRSQFSAIIGGKTAIDQHAQQLIDDEERLRSSEQAYADFTRKLNDPQVEDWSVYGAPNSKLRHDFKDELNKKRNQAAEFDNTWADVEALQAMKAMLAKPELSQEELNFIMQSELSSFFSDELRKKIQHTIDSMAKRDRTANVFKIMNEGQRQLIERQWKEHQAELKSDLKKVKAEKSKIQKALKSLKKKKSPTDEELKTILTLEKDMREANEAIRYIDYELENQANWINQKYYEEQAAREIFEEDNDNLAYLKTEEGLALSQENQDLIRKQATDEKARQVRIKKRAGEIAKRENPLVSGVMDYESKHEVSHLISQAEYFRRKQITDFIEQRFKHLSGRLEEINKIQPPRFSTSQMGHVIRTLDELKGQFINQELVNTFLTQLDKEELSSEEVQSMAFFQEFKKSVEARLNQPLSEVKKIVFKDHFKQAKKNLDKVERHLKEMEKQVDTIKNRNENPEQFHGEIREKFTRLKGVMGAFTDERKEKLLEELDQSERNRIAAIDPADRHDKWDTFGESAEYKKRREAIESMGAMSEMVSEVNEQFNNLENLDPDEIADLKFSLDQLDARLNQFQPEAIDGRLGALKQSAEARRAINTIKNLKDPVAIEKALIAQFGPEHIQFLRQKGADPLDQEGPFFDDYHGEDLNKYTGGGMVFYQRSDGLWKIIVDKDNIGDIDQFVKNVIHELLHLEIESNDELMNEWIRLYGADENNPSETWNEIKAAYLAAFPDKHPPTNEGWTNKAVISELYANQNDEMMKPWTLPESEVKTPIDRLRLALTKGGPAKDLLGIDTEKYTHSFLGADDSSTAAQGMPSAPAAGADDSSDGAAETDESSGSSAIYRERIKKADDMIESLLKSQYLHYLPGAAGTLDMIRSYNKDTDDLNEEFADTSDAYLGLTVGARLDQVEEDLRKINKNIADIGSEVSHDEANPLRDLWNRSHFFSPEDFWQVGVDVMEWWKRRHGRKKADHAARIGTALADGMPIPYVDEFGMESKARAEKAEAEEVDEWKNRLSNKDAWELLSILKQLSEQVFPNADQLKAVLRILADKGRIDWRDPSLWTVLSKLQTSAHLSPDDDTLLRNPVLLEQKLHQAMGEIWDYDEYLELKRTNESNYESGKEKYAATLDRIQDQLTDRLDQLLAKHIAGENVDPQEYEGILEYCIKNGKSFAENIMFHLIMGIAKGLLPPDRGLSLDKHLNTWPATQWIYSKQPPLTKKDYEYYAKTYFPEEYAAGKVDVGNSKFLDFYWTMVQNDPMTIQRVRKSVSERSWDHDWGRSIACMGDANTAKRFLSGRSGQQEAKDTGVENSYAGAWMWFQRNAKHPERINARKEFSRQIAWVAMADGIIGHVAYFNGSSDIYTRGNASMLNAVPREGALSGHSDWITRDYRDRIRTLLDQVDPVFFNIIRDEAAAKENKEALGQRARAHLLENYPSLASEVGAARDIDQIYDKMDAIIQAMVNSMSEEQFNRFISTVGRLDRG